MATAALWLCFVPFIVHAGHRLLGKKKH